MTMKEELTMTAKAVFILKKGTDLQKQSVRLIIVIDSR